LRRGLILLITVAVTIFIVGFLGGTFTSFSIGFIKTETVTRYSYVFFTETVANKTTLIMTNTITYTPTTIEKSVVTTTIVETSPLPTFITITTTRTLTLILNMPIAIPSAPLARVSKGSSINIDGWIISEAMNYKFTEINKNITIVNNRTIIISKNYTYVITVLQLVNVAPWARQINPSMFSRIILVTSSSKSYEPIKVNVSQSFMAPNSYGFIAIKFLIDDNDYPSYLYTEVLVDDVIIRVEFEL
jgi:hypothetical protein